MTAPGVVNPASPGWWVKRNRTVFPAPKSLTLIGSPPTVRLPKLVVPTGSSLTLTGSTPTISVALLPVRVANGTGQGQVSGSGSTRTIVIPITVPSGATTIAVGLMCSHIDWQTFGSYSALSATSDVNGALTRSASSSGVIIGQEQGSVHIFTLTGPTPGVHNITCTFTTASGAAVALYGNAAAFAGVNSLSGAVSGRNNSSVESLNVTSSINDLAIFCGAWSVSAPTGFTGTSIYAAGSASGGTGDFIVFGEKAGAATVNFAVTSSAQSWCAVGLNLRA